MYRKPPESRAELTKIEHDILLSLKQVQRLETEY
jgi:hypothetical protein